MHILANIYEDGSRYICEMSNGNSQELIRVIDGCKKPGCRIIAGIDAFCDDNENGRQMLTDALRFLPSVIQPE